MVSLKLYCGHHMRRCGCFEKAIAMERKRDDNQQEGKWTIAAVMSAALGYLKGQVGDRPYLCGC